MEIKRAYELMVLSRPDMDEDQRTAWLTRTKDVLSDLGIELFHQASLARRMLAYPIGPYREGRYDLFYIATEPSRLAKIERHLKLDKVVLRYLLVRLTRDHVNYLKEAGAFNLPDDVRISRA